jgi:Uma2 family endonuclease
MIMPMSPDGDAVALWMASTGGPAGERADRGTRTGGHGGLTFEEFLRFEAAYAGDERFELRGGTVVMMSGGSERHDLMVMALFRVIDPAFNGGPCRVFVHNRGLRTSDQDGWYPDLLVRCGPAAHRRYETDARIVVEVLSPCHDPRDRIARLYAYQSLRSIETILFVDPNRRVAMVHERTAEGFWGGTPGHGRPGPAHRIGPRGHRGLRRTLATRGRRRHPGLSLPAATDLTKQLASGVSCRPAG